MTGRLRRVRKPRPARCDLLVQRPADHVREHLAGFKVPDDVVIGPLPTTSTGKVQKHVLRAGQDERG